MFWPYLGGWSTYSAFLDYKFFRKCPTTTPTRFLNQLWQTNYQYSLSPRPISWINCVSSEDRKSDTWITNPMPSLQNSSVGYLTILLALLKNINKRKNRLLLHDIHTDKIFSHSLQKLYFRIVRKFEISGKGLTFFTHRWCTECSIISARIIFYFQLEPTVTSVTNLAANFKHISKNVSIFYRWS